MQVETLNIKVEVGFSVFFIGHFILFFEQKNWENSGNMYS
jgi:hypothetical protein